MKNPLIYQAPETEEEKAAAGVSWCVWREDSRKENGFKVGLTDSNDILPSSHHPPNVSFFGEKGEAYGAPIDAVDFSAENGFLDKEGKVVEPVPVKPFKMVLHTANMAEAKAFYSKLIMASTKKERDAEAKRKAKSKKAKSK